MSAAKNNYPTAIAEVTASTNLHDPHGKPRGFQCRFFPSYVDIIKRFLQLRVDLLHNQADSVEVYLREVVLDILGKPPDLPLYCTSISGKIHVRDPVTTKSDPSLAMLVDVDQGVMAIDLDPFAGVSD